MTLNCANVTYIDSLPEYGNDILITAHMGGLINIYDIKIEEKIININAHSAEISVIKHLYKINKNYLASACQYDESIKIWDLSTKTCLKKYTTPYARVIEIISEFNPYILLCADSKFLSII